MRTPTSVGARLHDKECAMAKSSDTQQQSVSTDVCFSLFPASRQTKSCNNVGTPTDENYPSLYKLADHSRAKIQPLKNVSDLYIGQVDES